MEMGEYTIRIWRGGVNSGTKAHCTTSWPFSKAYLRKNRQYDRKSSSSLHPRHRRQSHPHPPSGEDQCRILLSRLVHQGLRNPMELRYRRLNHRSRTNRVDRVLVRSRKCSRAGTRNRHRCLRILRNSLLRRRISMNSHRGIAMRASRIGSNRDRRSNMDRRSKWHLGRATTT